MDIETVDRDDSREDEKIRRRLDAEGRAAASGLTPDEKVFAGIAYLGPLFLFPLLLRADSKFCQFHARQGGLAFAAEIVFILGMIFPSWIGSIFKFFAVLLFFFVAVAGIVIVSQGKMRPLPLIGKYFMAEMPDADGENS